MSLICWQSLKASLPELFVVHPTGVVPQNHPALADSFSLPSPLVHMLN